jgi:hypothetical protein
MSVSYNIVEFGRLHIKNIQDFLMVAFSQSSEFTIKKPYLASVITCVNPTKQHIVKYAKLQIIGDNNVLVHTYE